MYYFFKFFLGMEKCIIFPNSGLMFEMCIIFSISSIMFGMYIILSISGMVFGMYDAESNVNPGNNTAQVTHIRDELIKCGF